MMNHQAYVSQHPDASIRMPKPKTSDGKFTYGILRLGHQLRWGGPHIERGFFGDHFNGAPNLFTPDRQDKTLGSRLQQR